MSYYTYMHRHFTGLLLKPSSFSAIITTCIALALVTISNWSYVLERLFFYDYLFGSEGLVTHLNTAATTGGLQSLNSFIGGSVGYTLFILGVAILVGITVYIFLQAFGRVANDASATWESLHAQTTRGVREIAERWVIRIIVALAWMAYATLFMQIIIPFCILAAQVGIQQLWALSGLGYLALSTALVWGSLHVHVIFIRLLVLRVRVFGGNTEILEDEFRDK